MNIIPVITLKQPWASWVMKGWKTKESRIHPRFQKLVGLRHGIHAAKGYDKSDYVLKNPYLTQEQISESLNFPTGVILGSVKSTEFLQLTEAHEKDALIECRSITRYGLTLTNAYEWDEKVAINGELSIWYFDLDNNKKVSKKLYEDWISDPYRYVDDCQSDVMSKEDSLNTDR